jgi:hypothetical protein
MATGVFRISMQVFAMDMHVDGKSIHVGKARTSSRQHDRLSRRVPFAAGYREFSQGLLN